MNSPNHNVRGFTLVLCSVTLLLLTGCGAKSGPAPETLAASLNGNWLISTGSTTPLAPDMSMTLGTVGTAVYGVGYLQIGCLTTNTPLSPLAPSLIATFPLTGTVADDGSFTLSFANPLPQSATVNFAYSLAGKIAADSSTWTAIYTADFTPGQPTAPITQACTGTHQTGIVTPTSFASVKGTFTGQLTDTRLGTGATTFSMQLTQQSLLTPTTPINITFPIQGIITVSGSSCFTHGTTTTSARQSGRKSTLVFTMDDGSTLTINAALAHPVAPFTAFSDLVTTIRGGACDGFITGSPTFTQQ